MILELLSEAWPSRRGSLFMKQMGRILGAVLAGLTMASCSLLTGPDNPVVTLEGRFEGDSLFMTLSNEGPGGVGYFSCGTQLQRQTAIWESVAWRPRDWACIMEATQLEAGETTEFGLPIPDSLEPGRFRWSVATGSSSVSGQVTSGPFQLERP